MSNVNDDSGDSKERWLINALSILNTYERAIEAAAKGDLGDAYRYHDLAGGWLDSLAKPAEPVRTPPKPPRLRLIKGGG